MTKLFITLCLGLFASVSLAFGISFISRENTMLRSISKEECEAICLVDPERCQTDCKSIANAPSEEVSFASTTLLSDGLGDCIIFTCSSGTWRACCQSAGVVPQDCNCATNPPICYCYGNGEQ